MRLFRRLVFGRLIPSFNSRTLGRVRLNFPDTIQLGDVEFQFTHPGKGATVGVGDLLHRLSVSIHAPWEGCDCAILLTELLIAVSIHAPWEGCDSSQQRGGRCCALCFNSRTLGRVRLLPPLYAFRAVQVSIHAPWEGCDMS